MVVAAAEGEAEDGVEAGEAEVILSGYQSSTYVHNFTPFTLVEVYGKSQTASGTAT